MRDEGAAAYGHAPGGANGGGGERQGAAGHDLERLRRRYVLAGGAWLPQEIADAFNGVSEWGIVLRYSPAETPAAQAASFLAYVDTIVTWADGRL